MRPTLFLAALAVLASVLPACGSLGDDDSGLTGTWEGTVTGSEVAVPVTLRLRDNGQTVTGTGVGELPGERWEFNVIGGSFVDRNVMLDFQYEVPPFKGGLDGTLVETSPGRISGTFQGRGAANGSVEIEIVDR